MGIVAFLVLGALAGWLAGVIMKGRGFGLLGNMAVGIVGAMLGGPLLAMLGLFSGGGFVGQLVTATIGALVLLFVVGLIRKA